MASPYRLILFDCVNTLYLPDASRRPVTMIDGVVQPSTAGLVSQRLAGLLPGLDPADLHRAQRSSWQWAESQRGEEHREIVAEVRFRRVLDQLGVPSGDAALVEELMRIHYDAVVGCFDLPDAHIHLLDELRHQYRLAMFSNFDHAPPIADRLAKDGLDEWLNPIIISADIGWRKPGATAFRIALDAVGEDPEHILFVGDTYGDDVVGAFGAGIDVAWINLQDKPRPEGPEPTFELRQLTDLRGILSGKRIPGNPSSEKRGTQP